LLFRPRDCDPETAPLEPGSYREADMKVVIDNQHATHDDLLAVSNALQETNDKPFPTGHARSG
jgi:hypothetical protein